MTIADKLALLEQTKEAQRVKLGLPEHVPFSRYHEFFEYNFDPRYLFLNGEQGVWFDPSDLSTMFQDVHGRVPVTKDGDPVGLILDKSNGLALGSELVTNGSFTTDSGWGKSMYVTWTEDNVYRIEDVGGQDSHIAQQLVGTIKNKTYEFKLKVGDRTAYSAGFRIRFGTRSGGAEFGDHFVHGSSNTEIVFYRTVPYDDFWITPHVSTTDTYVEIKSISVREIKGNHAIQETASSRPIYRTDGNLHWLEFDGVDDCLYSNQYPRKTPQNVVISASRSNTNQIYLTGTANNHAIFSSVVATNNYLGMFGSVGEITEPAIFNKAPTANIVHALWNNEKSYVFLNGNTYDRETAPVSPTAIKGIGIGVASATWMPNKLAGNVYQVVSFEGVTNIEDSLKIRRYVSSKAGIEL